MKKTMIAVIFAWVMTVPSHAQDTMTDVGLKQPITVTTTDKIKGLAEVKPRGKFHHTFVYETDSGEKIELKSKIKGVKDLRPLNVAHPHQVRVRTFAAKWNGTAQLGANIISACVYLAALFR